MVWAIRQQIQLKAAYWSFSMPAAARIGGITAVRIRADGGIA